MSVAESMSLPTSSRPIVRVAICAILLMVVELIGFYARWSLAVRHDGYLVEESDGRNYNLTVEMAKRRDFTPIDVSEPTLSFYLRQPVVWASYYISRANGEMSSLEELQTRDQYGPSGFAFAVSHPTVLRWSRMFSVAVSLLVIALTFGLSFQILKSPGYAFIAALIPALSPELLRSSYLIDGETLMIALCLGSSLVGVRAVTSGSRISLIICAVLSGLSGAAEYRGLWSVVIPIAVWAFGGRQWPTLVCALAGSLVGFLIGNPYGLAQWEGFAHDALTYKLVGSGDAFIDFKRLTNVDQASLLLGWLLEEGVGIVAAGLAAASSVYFVKCFHRRLAVFLSFPLFYLLLVFVRDADFMRTVNVLVPYVAVMASCGLHRLSYVAELPSVKTGAPPSLTALIVIQLGIMCVLLVRGNSRSDSRDLLLEWLRAQPKDHLDIAVAGPLQISEARLRGQGVLTVDPAMMSTARLLQDGYSYFVTTPVYSRAPDSDLVRLVRRIPGRFEKRDIPDSPVIDIYALREEGIETASRRAPATILLRVASTSDTSSCSDNGEDFCWVSARKTTVLLSEPTSEKVRAVLSARSPWDDQEIVVTTPLGTELYRGVMKASSEWSTLVFPLPPNIETFSLSLTRVHQLSRSSSGEAPKRVGMAIRQIRFESRGNEPAYGLSALLAGYPEDIRSTVLEALTVLTEEHSPAALGGAQQDMAHQQVSDGSIYDVIEQVSGEGSQNGSPAIASGASASEDAAQRARSNDDFRRAFLDAMVASMSGDGSGVEVGIPSELSDHPSGDEVVTDEAQ